MVLLNLRQNHQKKQRKNYPRDCSLEGFTMHFKKKNCYPQAIIQKAGGHPMK
jgi:hypothetical protein